MPKSFRSVPLLALLAALSLLAAGCGCGDDDDDGGGAPIDDDTGTDDDTDGTGPSDDDSDDDDNDDDDDDDDFEFDDDADDDDDDDADDDTSDPTVESLIASGKDWLSIGEGDKARLDFLAAYALDPAHPETSFGVVMSNAVHEFDVFGIIYDYVLSVLDYGGPVAAEEDNLLDTVLQIVADGLVVDRAAELADYAGIALALGDPQFTHDGIPIFLHFEHVATLSTQFDSGELHAAHAFAALFSGVFRHLTAISLDTDVSAVFVIMDILDSGLPDDEKLGAIVDLLIDMLTNDAFPDFLTLPPANVPDFQLAGLTLGDGFGAFAAMADAIRVETDNPEDDVLSYFDANGSFTWDDGEPFVLPSYGALSDDEMLLFEGLVEMSRDLRDAFWDDTAKDVDPANDNPFPLADLNPILRYFGLPPVIPDWAITRIDIGDFYADPGYDGIKQLLLDVLLALDQTLP
ncbi:hypothetical protein K8I61_16100 [bacterium]|nr:hypothetical protein [bacterium]